MDYQTNLVTKLGICLEYRDEDVDFPGPGIDKFLQFCFALSIDVEETIEGMVFKDGIDGRFVVIRHWHLGMVVDQDVVVDNLTNFHSQSIEIWLVDLDGDRTLDMHSLERLIRCLIPLKLDDSIECSFAV